MKFDLHMHSHYSKDGEKSPAELIQRAYDHHLNVVALCDHDSIQGVKEMIEEGKKHQIQVIEGIECSTLFDGGECHLLGYHLDLEHPYFLTLTDKINQLMEDAFHERVVKLETKYDIKIDEEEILKEAKDENPWFTMCHHLFHDPIYAHVEDFKDYRKGGNRCDPAPVNFFWDKCQKGSDLYVRVEFPSFKKSVDMIHEAGGLAVLAHPFKTFYQREDLLMKAIEDGIDGIEVFSNYHEKIHNNYYLQFAREHDLLITAGSDYHGKNKPSIEMGQFGDVEDETILKTFLEKIS